MAISHWENLSISRAVAGRETATCWLGSGSYFTQRITSPLGFILSQKALVPKIGDMLKFYLLQGTTNHPRRNSFYTDWIKTVELWYTEDDQSLSSCYRKADMREFDWVWPFETSKWDFNLSTIGFFFFFLLQIWFLWKWGINTTDPSSVQVNLCLRFPTKTFNSCYTLQPDDCCYFTLQHLFSAYTAN